MFPNDMLALWHVVQKASNELINIATGWEKPTFKMRQVIEWRSFLHKERRKRDLTLFLSFSLFLTRGNIFREAFNRQVRPHGRRKVMEGGPIQAESEGKEDTQGKEGTGEYIKTREDRGKIYWGRLKNVYTTHASGGMTYDTAL